MPPEDYICLGDEFFHLILRFECDLSGYGRHVCVRILFENEITDDVDLVTADL